jgi:glutamate racemase
MNGRMRFGLFDSGVGGLSVLQAMLAQQPGLHALYVADTAWLPYGTKDPRALTDRIRHIVTWLTPQVDCLVVACNTSAALLRGHWAELTPLPVCDPITACAIALQQDPTCQHIGVLATPNTVNSMAYPLTLQRLLAPRIPSVMQVACPGLADAVEQHTLDTPALQAQLNDWVTQACTPVVPQYLILGCTHYPFAQAAIRAFCPAGVQLLNPADALALQVPRVPDIQGANLQLLTTGNNAAAFAQQVQSLHVGAAIKTARMGVISL